MIKTELTDLYNNFFVSDKEEPNVENLEMLNAYGDKYAYFLKAKKKIERKTRILDYRARCDMRLVDNLIK